MMSVCVAALMASHPPSSRLPPNRTTLPFHTLSKPARILTLSLRRSKSEHFSSSSLTGSTWTVTALLPSKLVASKISPLSLLKPSCNTLSTASGQPAGARIRALSLPRPKSQLFPSLSLTGSTRTVTALLPSKLVASYTLPTVAASRPLFFAPISDGSAPGTPIAVIAAGLVRRCIEIYGRVLLIRILLSLYPNLEWDKQPMAAIRDLCDPFLSLFRGIIPPLFNSLDVTPILAFLLLGMLGQFAKSP